MAAIRGTISATINDVPSASMNRNLINILLLLSLATIAYLVLNPTPQEPVSEKEMANISKAISNEFSRAASAQTNQPTQRPEAQPVVGNTQQAIIGAIYKKSNTTWFFKAKDTAEKIDGISASFKNYFVDQLKFDQDEQPILTHIPESMQAANTSTMRVATYRIAGVEISVSKLSGNQDVYANVQRWMKQIGLAENSPIQIEYKDDQNTILVKMPQ